MAAERRVPTVRIGGIPIAALRYEEALTEMLEAPSRGSRLAIHFCTAHTLVEAADDEALRCALIDGNLDVPDGVPLVWVGRARGHRIERVCGLDVLPDIADRGRARGARHFFYGGGEGVAERLAARLSSTYPGLIVAGFETPPFRPLTDDEGTAMVARLNAARPDYVWVGLGTPKQDLWLAEYRDRLDAAALLAVGAAFDIVGGLRPRAPRIMQRGGLEWLFRLYQEPRRLARRYTVINARFIGMALTDIARSRRLRSRGPSGRGADLHEGRNRRA
jgi:N-acetylglucosaminyldiphosphoundecaprenol N-acetyl-beta-D-mannosaminyltransferase